jgi:Ala-tRNA(Pro) deacylase
MIVIEKELLGYLQQEGIPYQRIEHPPVFTCDEAEHFRPQLSGVSTKNLFLEDKRGNAFLLMTDCEKRTNLKALGSQLGVTKLHLGSEKKLQELLGVSRGAVTVLGLINDERHQVELLVDEEIWDGEYFLCHPLVNTATLVLAKNDLIRFFATSGHDVNLVVVPAR